MNLTFERIIINAKKEFALLFFQARLCNGCFQVYMMGVVLVSEAHCQTSTTRKSENKMKKKMLEGQLTVIVIDSLTCFELTNCTLPSS